jgi:hypothetical protein
LSFENRSATISETTWDVQRVAINKTHKFIPDGNRFDYYLKLPRDFAQLVTNLAHLLWWVLPVS